MMTIKQLAAATGASPDALRYYEREGLLPPAARASNGYRQYDQGAVRRVRFVRTAQCIGFSLGEIRTLLLLQGAEGTSCADVRRLAVAKRDELREKIRLMQAMMNALDELIGVCVAELRGLDECPILAGLERGFARTAAAGGDAGGARSRGGQASDGRHASGGPVGPASS